ncbi:glycosyltransferase family 2 protein [Paenibacillus sp. N4]|uniref:glycosyltransferase family 2 protein n=1 Tax=Paenibacillus vietnamensis TaxID=2590547 RepID=UPI001CD0D163|nr:glycosyltransferase family 2 protein [Paenibacillus vietnamensis]MCA0754958.1 glycosyltransferase family 2 protein [Paenibacillus vietnamensis]
MLFNCEEPVLSICLPVFNEKDTIDHTIQSILFQSFKNFELIITDNCSTDGTSQIIESYKDERIKIWRNEINLGWRLNSNLALSKATGKYVVTLHGGDHYIQPSYFERVVELFERNPNVGVIHFVPMKAFQKVFNGRGFMRSKDYYSFIGSLRYMPAPPVTVYRNEAIQGSEYYAKNFWTGEARLSLHIAKKGYDALIEINHYIERSTSPRGERNQPARMKERHSDRLDFYMEYRRDPKIKKQDLLFLQQSLKTKPRRR